MENKNNDKHVLVYGTFDLMHAGHFNLIFKARKIGRVHIALRPVDEVLEKKATKLFQNDEVRKDNLERLIIVDSVDVAPGDVENTVRLCEKYNIDFIVAGADHLESEIHRESSRLTGAEVIFFDRTEGISSTQLRNSIKDPE